MSKKNSTTRDQPTVSFRNGAYVGCPHCGDANLQLMRAAITKPSWRSFTYAKDRDADGSITDGVGRYYESRSDEYPIIRLAFRCLSGCVTQIELTTGRHGADDLPFLHAGVNIYSPDDEEKVDEDEDEFR